MAELAAAAPPLVVALPDAAAATATAPLSPAPPSPEKRACVLVFVLFFTSRLCPAETGRHTPGSR
jgi:hypothetical protein